MKKKKKIEIKSYFKLILWNSKNNLLTMIRVCDFRPFKNTK